MQRDEVVETAVTLGSRAGLSLEVAGIGFNLELPDQALREELAMRYGAYVTTKAASWTVQLLYRQLPGDAEPWIEHDGPLTRFQLATHIGSIDFEAQVAQVSAPSAALAPSALERVLAYVCMQELPRQGAGLLLHAAGIEIGGEGHVFCGASGRGKSTVARLAEEAGIGRVLVDEAVILQWRDGRLWLVSTPFWSVGTPTARVRRAGCSVAPLRAIYSLSHAPDFSLTPLRGARAVMELLTTEKVATERASSASAWMAAAQRVVEMVPLYRLAFRPTRELWSFLSLS